MTNNDMSDEELKEYVRERYEKIEELRAEIKSANELAFERERQEQINRKVDSIPEDVKNAIINAAAAGLGAKAFGTRGDR